MLFQVLQGPVCWQLPYWTAQTIERCQGCRKSYWKLLARREAVKG